MSILTFLFTDIEGSTRRWEADPDAMHSAVKHAVNLPRSIRTGRRLQRQSWL
jgi:class 3 adenylate cyclase